MKTSPLPPYPVKLQSRSHCIAQKTLLLIIVLRARLFVHACIRVRSCVREREWDGVITWVREEPAWFSGENELGS
jgi:hypothetical protein